MDSPENWYEAERIYDGTDYSVSIGTIEQHAKSAGMTAKIINTQKDLSNIKTAMPDELFQHNKPILAGVFEQKLATSCRKIDRV